MQRPSIITGRSAAGNASRCFWCAFYPVRVSAGEIVLQILEGIFGGGPFVWLLLWSVIKGIEIRGDIREGPKAELNIFVYSRAWQWVGPDFPTHQSCRLFRSAKLHADGVSVLIPAPISASVVHMLPTCGCRRGNVQR
jgi:hypothetical protein